MCRNRRANSTVAPCGAARTIRSISRILADCKQAMEALMNPIRQSIALAAVVASLVAAPTFAASENTIHRAGAVPYASGGISEEGREDLSAIAKDFNLKLVLATKSGAYLSDIDVVVSDERGHRILDAKSDGPWFFVRLPSGRYSIAASANGVVVRKAVTVGPQQLSRVDLRWDD
jgi:hypothetical protein